MRCQLRKAYKAEFVADEQTKTENPPTHNLASGIRRLVDNNIMERVNYILRGRGRNY